MKPPVAPTYGVVATRGEAPSTRGIAEMGERADRRCLRGRRSLHRCVDDVAGLSVSTTRVLAVGAAGRAR